VYFIEKTLHVPELPMRVM